MTLTLFKVLKANAPFQVARNEMYTLLVKQHAVIFFILGNTPFLFAPSARLSKIKDSSFLHTQPSVRAGVRWGEGVRLRVGVGVRVKGEVKLRVR